MINETAGQRFLRERALNHKLESIENKLDVIIGVLNNSASKGKLRSGSELSEMIGDTNESL